MSKTAAKEMTIDFAPPVAESTTVPAVVQAAPVPAPMGNDTSPILGLIERASRDPNVDIDKMERLFRMKLDMEARDAKAAYLSALAEMQPKLPVITKHGVIGMNEKDDRGAKTGKQVAMTKYARWEDVVEGITPILAEHGFSLSFRIAQPTPDRIAVSGVLGHRGGHTEETTISLPIDTSGSKNNVQGWGSSTSYGKRYTSFALLNISARGEDDDGNGAAGGDDDIESLAPKNAPRDANGKLLSAYDAGKAELAQKFADEAIQYLNMVNAKDAHEWRRFQSTVQKGKRKSPLQWLSDASPGQYIRVRQCYQNVTGEDLE